MPIGVSPDRGVSVMAEQPLGDFTATRRIVMLSAIAVVLGGISAFLALILLRMIAFFTNLFFYGRISTSAASPADNNLGAFVILIPVIGALIIGVMARFGSERIRGHGIPEAIEAILISGSRIAAQGRPAQAALLGDLHRLRRSVRRRGSDHHDRRRVRLDDRTALPSHRAERKTLLVAGAAAGMSATFASPVAAVLLAVELLLFEWKPRSLDPSGAGQRDRGRDCGGIMLGLGSAVPGPAAPGRSSARRASLGCVVGGSARRRPVRCC